MKGGIESIEREPQPGLPSASHTCIHASHTAGEVMEEAEEHLKKRTLVAKTVGLVLAAGAGLSIGREGKRHLCTSGEMYADG